MRNCSEIKVGIYTVPVTSELRENFERIHQEKSGSLPFEKQFSAAEQEEMFVACMHDDKNQQAGNLLELIHYLASQGVPVNEITPKARCSTVPSYDGVAPRSLAMRIMLSGLAAFEGLGSAELAFAAPKFEEAAA